MRTHTQTRLIHLPAYMASLALVACAAPPAEESHLIQPEVDVVDADLQRVDGFSEQALYELLVAEFAGSRGQLEDSVQRYLEMARTTRDAGVIERAARIALYAEENDAARQAAELWLEVDAQSPSAHQILGSLALQSGDEEAALYHFRAIIAEPGPLPPKLWLIIGALQRTEGGDEAVRIMDEVMREFSGDDEIMLNYAGVLMRLNKFDEAAAIYETLVAKDADINLDAIQARLAIFRITGLEGEAAEWLAGLLQSLEGDAQNTVRLYYAQELIQVDRLLLAMEHLEILIDAQPDNSEALLSAGILYLELNRNTEASRIFHLLLEQDVPFVYEASYFLGWLAEQREDITKAVQWYSAVPSGIRYPSAKIRIAVLQAGDGKLEQARLDLMQIANDHPEQRNQVVQAEAELLVDHEQLEDALRVYERTLGDRYDPELLYSRALLAERIDRLDLLEQDLKRVIERDPENVQALNALGYTLADLTDRYDEAYGLIKRALLLSPYNFYVLDSMGWVLYRLGRLEESEYYLRRSTEVKFDPVAAAHLAEVLWKRTKRSEARKILDKAARLHPDDKTVQATRARLQ